MASIGPLGNLFLDLWGAGEDIDGTMIAKTALELGWTAEKRNQYQGKQAQLQLFRELVKLRSGAGASPSDIPGLPPSRTLAARENTTQSSLSSIPVGVPSLQVPIYNKIRQELPTGYKIEWGKSTSVHGMSGGPEKRPQAVVVSPTGATLPINIEMENANTFGEPVISASVGPRRRQQRDIFQPEFSVYVNPDDTLSHYAPRSSIDKFIGRVVGAFDLAQKTGVHPAEAWNKQRNEFSTAWNPSRPGKAATAIANFVGINVKYLREKLVVNSDNPAPLIPNVDYQRTPAPWIEEAAMKSLQNKINSGAFQDMFGVINLQKKILQKIPGATLEGGEWGYTLPATPDKWVKQLSKLSGIPPTIIPGRLVPGKNKGTFFEPIQPEAITGKEQYYVRSQEKGAGNLFVQNSAVMESLLPGQSITTGTNAPSGTSFAIKARYTADLPGNINDLIQNLKIQRDFAGEQFQSGKTTRLFRYGNEDLTLRSDATTSTEDSIETTMRAGQTAFGESARIEIPMFVNEEGNYTSSDDEYYGKKSARKRREYIAEQKIATEAAAQVLSEKTGLPVLRVEGLTSSRLVVDAIIPNQSAKNLDPKAQIFPMGEENLTISGEIGGKEVSLPRNMVIGTDIKSGEFAKEVINVQSSENVFGLFNKWAKRTGTKEAASFARWMKKQYPGDEEGMLNIDYDEMAAKYSEMTGKNISGTQLAADVVTKVFYDTKDDKERLANWNRYGVTTMDVGYTMRTDPQTQEYFHDQAVTAIKNRGGELTKAAIEQEIQKNLIQSKEAGTTSVYKEQVFVGKHGVRKMWEPIGARPPGINSEMMGGIRGLVGEDVAAGFGVGAESMPERGPLDKAKFELWSTYSNAQSSKAAPGGTVPENAQMITENQASDIGAYLQTSQDIGSREKLAKIQELMGLQEGEITNVAFGKHAIISPAGIDQLRWKNPEDTDAPDRLVKRYEGALAELAYARDMPEYAMYKGGEHVGPFGKFVEDIIPTLEQTSKDIASRHLEGSTFEKYAADPLMPVNEEYHPEGVRRRVLASRGVSSQDMDRELAKYERILQKGEGISDAGEGTRQYRQKNVSYGPESTAGVGTRDIRRSGQFRTKFESRNPTVVNLGQRIPGYGGAESISVTREMSHKRYTRTHGQEAFDALKVNPESQLTTLVNPIVGQLQQQGDFDADMRERLELGLTYLNKTLEQVPIDDKIKDLLRESTYKNIKSRLSKSTSADIQKMADASVMGDLFSGSDNVQKVFSRVKRYSLKEMSEAMQSYNVSKAGMANPYNNWTRLGDIAGAAVGYTEKQRQDQLHAGYGGSQGVLDLKKAGAQTEGINLIRMLSKATIDDKGRLANYLFTPEDEGEAAIKLSPERVGRGGVHEYMKAVYSKATEPMQIGGEDVYPLTAKNAAYWFSSKKNNKALLKLLKKVDPKDYGNVIKNFYDDMVTGTTDEERRVQNKARDEALMETPFFAASVGNATTKTTSPLRDGSERDPSSLLSAIGEDRAQRFVGVGFLKKFTTKRTQGLAIADIEESLRHVNMPQIRTQLQEAFAGVVAADTGTPPVTPTSPDRKCVV